MSGAAITKPIKYPPVGESSVPMPPVNPEKTGTPMIPRSRYASMAKKERFTPNRPAIKHTASDCRVMGMLPIGTAIHAQTQISATATAV